MTLLRFTERTLFAIGLALAGWCVFVITEAHRTNQMPVPIVIKVLPDDQGTTADRPAAPAPGTAPPGTWLARLQVPSVHLTATVLEGSDDGTLRRGAGHIEDTALPGQAGNIGIAGHRDTIFRPLRHVRVGDALELTTGDRIYYYRIVKTQIVDPDAVYVLDPTPQPTVTLVTCYPFTFLGHAPRRFVVQATLQRDETRAAPGAGGAN